MANAVRSPKTLVELVESLPRTSKEFVQHSFTDMQVPIAGTNPDDFVLHKTSGSTGRPTRVRKLRNAYFIEYDAYVLVDWAWHKRDINKSVGGIRVDAPKTNNVPAGPPLTYINANLPQFSRSATENSPGEMLDALEETKAAYVYTNPVTVRLMAQEQMAHPRKGIVLEQFLTVSDRTDQSTRDIAMQAFGAKLCDRYSSEEFGFIALQCPVHEHLHVLSPSVYVEIVDELGHPCEIGQPGQVLVTALHSFAQPMIRYEIGDIAEWGEPCDAGITWPVIKNIVGRIRQYLPDASGEKKLVTIVSAKFLSLTTLRDFQIIKFNDSIVMVVAVTDDFGQDDEDVIIQSMHEVFRSDEPVHVIKSANPQWRSAWKRHEFDIVDTNFNSDWSLAQILEQLHN